MEKKNIDMKINSLSRIIVPLYESPEIDQIVNKALSLAKEIGREVLALYIIDTPKLTEVIPPDGLTTSWESLLTVEGQKLLDKIETEGKKMGIQVKKKVIEGIPENVIIKEAKKNDLIVIGCKSKNIFDRFLENNVCEKVISQSTTSVMTFQIK